MPDKKQVSAVIAAALIGYTANETVDLATQQKAQEGVVVRYKKEAAQQQRFNPYEYFVPAGCTALVRIFLPTDTGKIAVDYPLIGQKCPEGWGSRLDVKAKLVCDILTQGYGGPSYKSVEEEVVGDIGKEEGAGGMK